MNDIDDLKADVSWLDDRITWLEGDNDKRPFFLYGRNGAVRRCIAVFSTEMQCKSFIRSCRLKNPKKNQVYRKNSPLFWWDELSIEREYVPDHVFFNPTLEDFDERNRD